MYSVIAPYYRNIAQKEYNLFEKEAAILNNLISSILSYNSPPLHVLDLACGIGDTATIIAEKNINLKVYGCDTSPEMLKEASNVEGSKVTFFKADWEDASTTFKEHNKFHLIWIMGNSIAHWPVTKLFTLFTTIANEGLYPGGIFVCDMRRWKDKNVNIIDPSKGGEWKDYPANPYVSSNGIKANVRRKDSYIQKVEYELTPLNGSPVTTSLTYHIFTCDELKQALYKAGFSSVIEYSEEAAKNYLFQVLVAHKT